MQTRKDVPDVESEGHKHTHEADVATVLGLALGTHAYAKDVLTISQTDTQRFHRGDGSLRISRKALIPPTC